MTVFLNILLMVMSVLFFAGRLYEILFLMEASTGFLLYNPIASSPFIIAILVVIAFCCAVMIFSKGSQQSAGNYSEGKIFLIFIGALFCAGGIIGAVSTSNLFYYLLLLIGGAGFVMLGLCGLKGKGTEVIPVLMISALCIGCCLNSIILDVSSIYDTRFLMRSISAVTNLIFFMLLFQAAYSPKKNTPVMVYIFGFLNFIFTGVSYAASLIGSVAVSTFSFGTFLPQLAFIGLGLYSLFMALMMIPEKKSAKAAVTEPAAAVDKISFFAQKTEKSKAPVTKAQNETSNSAMTNFTSSFDSIKACQQNDDTSENVLKTEQTADIVPESPINQKAVVESLKDEQPLTKPAKFIEDETKSEKSEKNEISLKQFFSKNLEGDEEAPIEKPKKQADKKPCKTPEKKAVRETKQKTVFSKTDRHSSNTASDKTEKIVYKAPKK